MISTACKKGLRECERSENRREWMGEKQMMLRTKRSGRDTVVRDGGRGTEQELRGVVVPEGQ